MTSGKRSIFGSTSWRHPHPPVTQKVAQPAAACSSIRVDVIGWCREAWPSDVPAASGTTPDTAPQTRWMVSHSNLTWGLLMGCGSFVHGTPGICPPSDMLRLAYQESGRPSRLGFLFLCLPAWLLAPTASQSPARGDGCTA